MNESIFRILFGLFFAAFFAVRAFNHNRAVRDGGEITYREKNLGALQAIRQVLGMVWLGAIGLYLFQPAWIAWAAISLPGWLRWVGVVLAYVSLPLIWWTEVSLGHNFNATLHVREGHTLVTHGPYRWVRHPMYSALLVMVAGMPLITANLLVGLPPIIGLVAILVNRVRHEEAVMVEQFGEQYQRYMARTGRFLPRLWGGASE